jgi:hypothetical protein
MIPGVPILRLVATAIFAAACVGAERSDDIIADPENGFAVHDEDDWAGTLEATVTGPTPLAGSYRSSGAGCVRTPTGWIIAHENERDRLRQSQAVLENMAGSVAGRMSLTLVFGDPTDPNDRSAGMLLLGQDGSAPPGAGTASITRDADDMTVTVEGRTAEGIQVSATYRCLALE